jgi:UDP-N-acetyl-D-galactosamine dehydrogenase
LIKSGTTIKDSKVLIMGFTFKENVKDIRNTKVIDIYNELKEYGINTFVYDPIAEPDEIIKEYGIELINRPEILSPFDSIIFAVKHDKFKDISLKDLRKMCRDNSVIIDIKGIFDKEEIMSKGFKYWRL